MKYKQNKSNSKNEVVILQVSQDAVDFVVEQDNCHFQAPSEIYKFNLSKKLS